MGNFKCISARMTWRFILCLSLSLFFVQGVSAAEYYWFLQGDRNTRAYYPESLCQYMQKKYHPSSDVYWRIRVDPSNPDTQRFCDAYTTYATVGNWQIARDVCPSGYTVNKTTGQCEAPSPPSKCEQLAGQNVTWTLILPDLNGLGAREHACMDGCRIALGTSSCEPAYEGSTTGVCIGNGQYTGAECQSSDSPTGGTPPKDPNPPKDPDEPTCGEGYSWSGTTCVKDPPKECDPSTGEVCPPKDPDNPGDGGDGDGDGDGGNGGGGSGDGGGDGSGDGDGTGSGDGDGGNGSGTCDPKKDPKCTPKPGDGEGQCDPAKDPNKCGQSTVAGEACDASVSCTGDAVQCAILRQQKAQRCADEEWRKVDEKAVTDLQNAIASNQSGDSFKPIVATAENTFSLDGVIDTSSRFSKACPTIPDWSVPWLDGKNLTVKLSFLSDFCNFLTYMGYLLVAFAMRRAAEIISGGMN